MILGQGAKRDGYELVKVIPAITSGVALAAFVAAVLAFIWAHQTRRRERILLALPEKDRLKAIRELADDLGISAKNVQSEARVVQLVMARMHQRAGLQRALFRLVFGISILASAVAAYQIFENGRAAQAVRPDRPAAPLAPASVPSVGMPIESPGASEPAGLRLNDAKAPRTTPSSTRVGRPTSANAVRASHPDAVPRLPPSARSADAPEAMPPVAQYGRSGGNDPDRDASEPVALLGLRVKVIFSDASAEAAQRTIRKLQ